MPFLFDMYCHGVRSLILLITSVVQRPDQVEGPRFGTAPNPMPVCA